MRRTRPSILVTLLAIGTHPLAARQVEPDVGSLLRGRLEVLRAAGGARAGGDPLLARGALPRFYEARGFEPVWTRDAPLGRLIDLESAVAGAAAHGLDPADYHSGALSALVARVRSGSATAAELADLELLASDAFMLLGSHLLHGRVHPETINPEWLANRRSAQMDEVLAEALAGERVAETLRSLAPQQARYVRMIAAAERLRALERAGGWPSVPEGPRLEVGNEGSRVLLLRERLHAGGDLGAQEASGAVFDEALAAAVRRFQGRHGLAADGVVGTTTLAAINVPAGARARQILTNLERWRWLPDDLGIRHIEVNIAGFDVKVVEAGRVAQTHRAVVGRLYRQTPSFTGLMTYLVLSPYWHVPPNIAAVDKLPAIKADLGAIAAQRMTLLDQVTNRPVDPTTVDWASITAPEFNRLYRLRQQPGPFNALGAVKFMFPNRHNVYLHDTPSRELFERSARDFSSGCIRIENPLDLAEYLLADQPEWSRGAIERAAAAGVERSVPLTAPVPVHLLYWTAWADEEGVLHFRDDIYGRDATVWRALVADPPGS
jgi:murein L,D-transpeptidase YcbB/YkuD